MKNLAVSALGIFLLTSCGGGESSTREKSTGIGYPADFTEEAIQLREAGDAGPVTEEKSEGFELSSQICSSKAKYSSLEHIKVVELESMKDESAADSGYKYNNDLQRMKPGFQYNLSLTPGFSKTAYNEFWRVWIDLNGDGIFSESEVVFNGSSKTTVTGQIMIPETAKLGKTTMRVSMRWGGAAPACGTFHYGEVQDYNIEITNTPWTASPNKLDVNGDLCLTPLDVLVFNKNFTARLGALPNFKNSKDLLLDINGDGKLSPLDQLILINAASGKELTGCLKPQAELKVLFPNLTAEEKAQKPMINMYVVPDTCSPMKRFWAAEKAKNPNYVGGGCGLGGTIGPSHIITNAEIIPNMFETFQSDGETDFLVRIDLALQDSPGCIEGGCGKVIKSTSFTATVLPGKLVLKSIIWSAPAK